MWELGEGWTYYYLGCSVRDPVTYSVVGLPQKCGSPCLGPQYPRRSQGPRSPVTFPRAGVWWWKLSLAHCWPSKP